MKILNFKKNSFLFVFLILICSCSYKPLFDEDQLGKFTVKNIEASGYKRIAQMTINKLNIIKNQTGDYNLFVYADKDIDVSNKSSTGKILEYSITLNYQIEAKNNLTGKKIYSKKISRTENYKSSDLYSDTISNEKKIIENISKLVAKQAINEIILVLQNDI